MTNQSVTTPAPQEASRYLPLLLILFAASGCSALIYEIVWYQLLQLAIGSTAVSLGFLLATFMGGLCLGSLGLPRLRAAAKQHPLRIYAALELGIGILGVLVLWCLPLIDRVYIAGAAHGLPGMLLRGFISAVCLLPPTILMGASLPAIVGWIEVHAARRLVVGPAVRRQYRGRGLRLPARRLLPAAPLRYGGGHLLGRGHQPGGGPAQFLAIRPHTSRIHTRRNSRRRRSKSPSDDAGANWPVYVTIGHLGRMRPGRRSGLDAPDGHAAGLHGLCVLHHPGGLSDRSCPRQPAGSWISRTVQARAWRWAGARCCSPAPSPGPPS